MPSIKVAIGAIALLLVADGVSNLIVIASNHDVVAELRAQAAERSAQERSATQWMTKP